MRRQDFYFDLPSELIAQYPLATRSASKLMGYQRTTQQISHHTFNALPALLTAKDLLVFNDTKVIPARLFGQKSSGGKVEILVERIIQSQQALCHIRSSKSPKPGSRIILADSSEIIVIGREGDLFHCDFAQDILPTLERLGRLPLPPYIERSVEQADLTRYQTIYANQSGAVAAPTAGLHFDEKLFAQLNNQGVSVGYITLHVGAGTFQPVRTDNIVDHKMHREYLTVSENLCQQIQQTKQAGGRVIAVGTTVVRSLETAAKTGQLKPYAGDTDIFIYPGYQFKVIDGMITNFHLPESTLLMLVSAFVGREKMLELYQIAINERYRFFSYGDAMVLL